MADRDFLYSDYQPTYFASDADHQWKMRHAALLGVLPFLAGAIAWILEGDSCWFWAAVLVPAVLILLPGAFFWQIDWRRIGSAVLVSYALLWVTWGAWAAVGYYFPVRTFVVSTNQSAISTKTRVTYEGTLLTATEDFRSFSIPVRGKLKADQLQIETEGPTGWLPRSFEVSGERIVLDPVSTVTVYVDNRDCPQTVLEYGDIRLTLAANSKSKLVVLTPPQGGSVTFRIAGHDTEAIEGQHMLLDIRGNNCYVFQYVYYMDLLTQAVASLVKNPNLLPKGAEDNDSEAKKAETIKKLGELYKDGLPNQGPAPLFCLGRHLHALPDKVDYFLEQPPQSLDADNGSSERRSVVRDFNSINLR